MNKSIREQRRRYFISKAVLKYGDLYDYSGIIFKNMKTKVDIICTKHNSTFSQTPILHLKGSGCKQCRSEKLSIAKTKSSSDFINAAIKIHGDKYDFSKIIYRHCHEYIYPLCHTHGIFRTTPTTILSGSGCPKCASDLQRIPFDILISEFEKIHGNDYRYDQSERAYVNSLTKIPIKCLRNESHGYFMQTPSDHKHGKGCPKCKFDNMKYTTKEFIMLANIRHNNLYDYAKTIYNGSRNDVIVTCNKHGDFMTEPNGHLSSGRGCPKCAHHISTSEIELSDYLKTLTTITTSDRLIIAPKELDIYIEDKQLALELNGIYWHGELKGCDKKYHINKTLNCNSVGVRLIHIFESEWLEKQKIVKSRLKNILGLTKYKLYGRMCTIKVIDTKTKNIFLNKYHIQGADKSAIKLGAFYRNRLIAVMTFGKRRFDNKAGYELIRYATIASFSCVGIAGKLLKHFELTYNPKVIISYANLRWSEGNLYSTLGFTHLRNSNPNYFYTKNGKIVGGRIKYQKHKLLQILNKFNPDLSEWENMKANGYDRIWDCGNMVFEKTVL